MGRLIFALTVIWIAMSTQTAQAGEPPPPQGAGISSRLNDASALIEGRRHLPHTQLSKIGAQQRPRTLISYQRVCSAGTRDNYAAADTCHRSTSLCGPEQTPAWIMTAPAVPAPTADDWRNTGRFACRSEAEKAAAKPVLTAADFRRLPIPPVAITVQPDPGTGPTLINIGTNFYADHEPRTLVTTVFGQRVRVRATPSSYTWHYGDGTTRTTTDPGGPYPVLSTSHTFTEPGTYTVTLTTTFTGEYATPAAPWQPVTGTAAVTGPATKITALEARNQLTR